MIKLANYNFTVTQLFEEQTRKTPQQVAVIDEFHSLTYAELNQKSNQLAYWLRGQGVQINQIIALLLPPSVEFIVSILAIIKAGGIYLPLDIQAPDAWNMEILKHICPPIIIANNHFSEELNQKIFILNEIQAALAHYPVSDIIVEKQYPESPLYILYTSGTTGVSKGVVIPHRAVVNLVKTVNYANISESEVIAQFSNIAFDASVFEIWSGLLNGGTVAIVPLTARINYIQLNQLLSQYRVDYLFLPTAFFNKISQAVPFVLDPVKTIFFGGEKANLLAIKQLIDHRRKAGLSVLLVNGYGPTETTVFVCRQEIHDESTLTDTIGKPIEYLKLYVLDENKAIVSPGEVGELYISGVNLGIGYYNNEILNKEKFLKNPFDNREPFQRLYRTGDLVRETQNGQIQFIGRIDDQVKVRGFRIHIGEIENELLKYPGIKMVAILIDRKQEHNPKLIAYLELDQRISGEINSEKICRYLRKKLPEYMLPIQYLKINEFPLTSLGKVDKKKLSSLPSIDLAKAVMYVSNSLIEEKLVKIWSNILHNRHVDPTKSFFELGAHSLLMIEASQRISEELQCPCDITTLLTYTSIRQLAQFLEQQSMMTSNK